MLFFSNPFLISGFRTGGVGEGKEAGMGRERAGERQKRDPGQTKRLAAPRGPDMVSVYTSHSLSSAGNE